MRAEAGDTGGVALPLCCSICGEPKNGHGRWFLVTENRWEDKLKILHWNEQLAGRAGVHQACGAAHVQELVVHWMALGCLDYPFARSGKGGGPARRWGDLCAGPQHWDTGELRPLGELSVHRESMKRVLSENPHSLKAILDALLAALQREAREDMRAGCGHEPIQPVLPGA
jgi:hypothetical protein